MKIDFQKFQGHGNDFIMINNLDGHYDLIKNDVSKIIFLCNRNFGIGSDGIIFLNSKKEVDFEMDFFNPDGSKSFCGNGARCAVSFAKKMKLIDVFSTFSAIDGVHESYFLGNTVKIKIHDINQIGEEDNNTFILDTGSPHYVHFQEKPLDSFDFLNYSREIRFSDRFIEKGININLAKQISLNKIEIRTYERGVENETQACGTGVTAAALALAFKNKLYDKQELNVMTLGGELIVEFVQQKKGVFTDVWLIGDAKFIYEGSIFI